MPTYSPYMQRAMEVLADGEWHNEAQVLAEMMKLIPPAVAIRRAERRRVNQRAAARATTPATRQAQHDDETLRVMGARHIAQDSLRQSRSVEYRRAGNDRWVRLRPR